MLPHLTAELTLGLILSLARHIPFEHQGMREGAWQRTVGIGLHGRKLGVVGLGKLGTEVARLCQALPHGGHRLEPESHVPSCAAQAGVEMVDKQTLFASADIVTVHMVLSERSRGIVDAASIGAMKKSAYLGNTSRGPLVDTQALISALVGHRMAGAAIDVYDEEPLPADHRAQARQCRADAASRLRDAGELPRRLWRGARGCESLARGEADSACARRGEEARAARSILSGTYSTTMSFVKLSPAPIR